MVCVVVVWVCERARERERERVVLSEMGFDPFGLGL